jgi:hypothetical protein
MRLVLHASAAALVASIPDVLTLLTEPTKISGVSCLTDYQVTEYMTGREFLIDKQQHSGGAVVVDS